MTIQFELCSPDPGTWNSLIETLPGAHILQTWEWAQVKAEVGWRPSGYIWRQNGKICAAALILQRTLRFGGISAGFKVLYSPRGPLLDWGDDFLRERVLDDLQKLARRTGAIFLKIDPDLSFATGIPSQESNIPNPIGLTLQHNLQTRGWIFSADQIQFRNTAILDLSPTDEELLAGMKQKTRYNIRLAEKKGVKIRNGFPNDFPGLYRMYAETSLRDGFVIREENYYQRVWERFLNAGLAEILIAEVEDQPVAAVVLLRFARRTWYLYGMSREIHRDKMPNYILQWKAMQSSKQAGCQTYDLWGAPDEFNEQDSMWGVYRFKEGLGAQVVRWVGAWDYPASAWKYAVYTRVLPRLLNILRRSGLRRTQREVLT